MIIIGPLWFLNLILVGLNLILIIFLGVTTEKIKINLSLNTIEIEKTLLSKSEIPILNNITDRDIFNTIIPSSQETKIFVFQPKNLVSLVYPPNPPEEIPIQASNHKEKETLPPLQIILHGTIITDNPLKNKVFIENMRTKEEKDYIIGDIIEDAQIVYINKYKVIFIRSNGQEEIIYLNKLIKIEEEAITNTPWTKIITVINANTKLIDLNLFNYKIKSLSSLIDHLGLITIFEKSVPIGCLIQDTEEGSLAHALGFKLNDIIISINNIPVNETDSRMNAYQLISENKNNKNFLISVTIKRDNEIMTLSFKLKTNEKQNTIKTIGILKINESEREHSK